MTAHDPGFRWPEQGPPSYSAAGSLVRPLSWLAILTVAAAAIVFGLSRSIAARLWPGFHLPGLGLTSGSLGIAALGLLACLGMVIARRRALAPTQDQATRTSRQDGIRWPQTIITLLLIAAAAYAVLADWPSRQTATAAPDGFTVASILLLMATPWLLAERYVAAIAPQRLPEADDLRTLLFVPVFFLGAQAILQVAATLGFSTFYYWGYTGLSTVLLLICAELGLRVLASWFLPPPDIATAQARISSILAGALRGRSLSPASMAQTVRSQFGMDFSRSWALHFVRVAALPVVLTMLLFCWFLTGVTRIDLNERGAYERFGTVAAILKPGLYLGLPWPLGTVRHVEFGVMHSALISYDDRGAPPDDVDHATAEGDAPSTANRLWDSEQPTDVSYVIASGEQNRQSFQTVSASLRVLYRIGLSDADARAALYREDDPDTLVRALSGRLLAQFFAARTLTSVLGENQSIIADEVKTQLRQALSQLGSGVDIVAVTIEALHPPAGAASAYRNVQAAEIQATTSIAAERGRAQTTQSVAQRDAHSATNGAEAEAAETVSAAKVDLIDTTADDVPYRAASRPFLLERYLTDLKTALANVPLQIIDHRLAGSSLPTIDTRPPGMIRDGADAHPAQGGKTQ